jgi:hypothetical protein
LIEKVFMWEKVFTDVLEGLHGCSRRSSSRFEKVFRGTFAKKGLFGNMTWRENEWWRISCGEKVVEKEKVVDGARHACVAAA